MIPIEIQVYSLADPTVRLNVLNGRIKPSFLEEIRGPGGGKLSLSVTDPKVLANPLLIQSRNVLKYLVDGVTVGAMVIDGRSSNIIDDTPDKEVIELSGESLRTWFNDATIYPEGGIKKTSITERSFNFSSKRGSWYITGDWDAPTNVQPWGDIAASPWRYAPADWPDVPLAYWIWSSDSTVTAPEGDNYFRYEFTTATDGPYSFFVAADNSYSVYIDGQLNMTSSVDVSTDTWSKTVRIDATLPAGDHVFAVKVTNAVFAANNPAALIAAIFRAGDASTETPATLISYTGKVGDTNWKVNPYPAQPPGWTPGEIVLTLLDEAEARGIRFPTWLTPTFNATTDSYGVAWPTQLDWSFNIGDSLTSVIDKLEELVCDLWIDPVTLQLNMAVERGVDRSVYGYMVDGITVNRPILVFEKGKNLGRSSIDSSGEIKNSLLIQTSEGWMEVEDTVSASQTTYGRIEGMVETGLSEALSTTVANFVFEKKALPEVGASYEILPMTGTIPWVDFFPGDWVLAPNEVGLLVKRRVMSLSVKEENDTGAVTYAAEFDTIFKDNEDKLSRWMSKMGGGSLGGQLNNSGGGSGIPIGTPVITYPPAGTVQIPNAVVGLSAVSSGLWEVGGAAAYSQVLLSWDPVTGSTDGSTMVPLGYEVWAHLAGEADSTYQLVSMVFTNSAHLQPYETGSTWEFKVRAVSASGEVGAFSDPEAHTMVAPSTPMNPPDQPVLTTSRGGLIVTWTGLLKGASTSAVPPPQFRYIYALVSPHGANTWTRIGTSMLKDTRTIYVSGLTIGASYDVKLRSVDGLGVESTDSQMASLVVMGITGPDIEANTVTANNVLAGTLTVNELKGGSTGGPGSVGALLNISGNVAITTQRAIYDFKADGAYISDPTSVFQLVLKNDRISIRQAGNEVSYWNAGTMYVNTFVGEIVTLGNHQIQKDGTGTVVRRI